MHCRQEGNRSSGSCLAHWLLLIALVLLLLSCLHLSLCAARQAACCSATAAAAAACAGPAAAAEAVGPAANEAQHTFCQTAAVNAGAELQGLLLPLPLLLLLQGSP
jgi:hypothetical protein